MVAATCRAPLSAARLRVRHGGFDGCNESAERLTGVVACGADLGGLSLVAGESGDPGEVVTVAASQACYRG